MLRLEQMRDGEELHLVETGVGGGIPDPHRVSRLPVSVQPAAIAMREDLTGIAQMRAEPTGLPRAKFAELVIADLVSGCGIGLAVADKGDLGDRKSVV